MKGWICDLCGTSTHEERISGWVWLRVYGSNVHEVLTQSFFGSNKQADYADLMFCSTDCLFRFAETKTIPTAIGERG